MKKFAAYCLEFFISKRLHVAFLAYVTVLYNLRCLGIASGNARVALLSSFIVWSAYLENLTTDKKEDRANKASHGLSRAIESRLFRIEKLYPVFYLASLILSLFISFKCFVFTLVTMAVFSSYVHKVLPVRGGEKRLKEIFIVKNITPALGWLFCVLIIPLAATGAVFIFEYTILILLFFLLSFREEIKFDISDAEGDKEAGIATFPNRFGLAYTKTVLYIIDCALFILLSATLFSLKQHTRIAQFDALLKNIVPLLVLILLDYGFIGILVHARDKRYCNIGIAWWEFLLAAYLMLRYPYNIFLFLLLKIAGSVLAKPLFAKYLKGAMSGIDRGHKPDHGAQFS